MNYKRIKAMQREYCRHDESNATSVPTKKGYHKGCFGSLGIHIKRKK